MFCAAFLLVELRSVLLAMKNDVKLNFGGRNCFLNTWNKNEVNKASL